MPSCIKLSHALRYLPSSGLGGHPAYAQIVLTPADSGIRVLPAHPSGGVFAADFEGKPLYIGHSGGDGYDAASSSRFQERYIVNGPKLIGGAGGETTGTDAGAYYEGGTGGDGLSAVKSTVTINSGDFTGGLGGTADGTGFGLFGGSMAVRV